MSFNRTLTVIIRMFLSLNLSIFLIELLTWLTTLHIEYCAAVLDKAEAGSWPSLKCQHVLGQQSSWATERRCIVIPVWYELNVMLCYVMKKKVDRLWGLVVRVPAYRTETYCASCEVRTEFICYAGRSRPTQWSSGQEYLVKEQICISREVGTEFKMLCPEEGGGGPVTTNGSAHTAVARQWLSTSSDGSNNYARKGYLLETFLCGPQWRNPDGEHENCREKKKTHNIPHSVFHLV
jgi:hypothetical protein